MSKIRINMKSSANIIKSQGVGSCYDEQVNLVKDKLAERFQVTENKIGKFDIVHYHTVNPGYFVERLINRKNTVGIGYVHFLPETLDKSLKLPKVARDLFYKYLLAFYNSMDYLVAVNPFFVEKIREYGISAPEVQCIPNFVSTRQFHEYDREEIVKLRRKYSLGADDFVVLGVGQLQTRKGIADFISTAKLNPNQRFVWAGGFSFGKMSDGYDEIKELMKDLPDNIQFIGIIAREDMPGLYNMADLMFLPSYDELFPMAILEALCCRRPVLVRDIELYETILKGCCLKGKDAEEFSFEIERLSGDKKLYEQWQDKAWRCHQMYTEENAVKLWEDFYLKTYRKEKAI